MSIVIRRRLSYKDYNHAAPIKRHTVVDPVTNEDITATISSLDRGIEHCFSVAAVDDFGNVSRPSQWVCGIPEKRYTKLDATGNELEAAAQAWEMVRDEDTNLIWEVKKDTDDTDMRSNREGFDPESTELNFIKYLNDNRFGGSDQWRIPSAQELFSLIEPQLEYRDNTPLAINTSYFPNIYYETETPPGGPAGPPPRFWTGVPSPDALFKYFFLVHFGEGGRLLRQESLYPAHYAARAVRGEGIYDLDDTQFTDNGNGTITDNRTQLMWQKASVSGTNGEKLLWHDANEKCNELAAQKFAGYDDWRMPKIKELISIMDYTNQYIVDGGEDAGPPVINQRLFDGPVVEHDCFWSSTRSHRNTGYNQRAHEYVYIANFWIGEILDGWDKVAPTPPDHADYVAGWNEKAYHVRAVRNIHPVDVSIIE